MMPKNTRRGFTTLELIVTLVLLGILAAVALPRMGLLATLSAPVFRDHLLASLQYARKTAVAARRHVCVDIADGTVTFKMDTREADGATFPLDCTGNVPLPVPGKECSPAAEHKICSPGGIALAVSGNVTGFAFDASGRTVKADDGSSLATVTLTVSGANGASSVVVESETGYVR